MANEVALQEGPGGLTAHRRSLKPLTGIRFFAAFYVVVFHTRTGKNFYDHGHHALGNFLRSGYLAVPLFFLLSGFILAYTYEGQIEKPGDHRRFWEARFARIWPVYAVSLVMASIPSFKLPPLGQAAAAMLMVQAWNPFHLGMAGVWNPVCWTLSAEAVFYIIFPWVQTWIEKRNTRSQLASIGLMLLLCVLINSGSRTLGYTAYGFWRWVPLPLPHVPEFLTGVGMGNYFLRRLMLRTTHPTTSLLAPRGVWTYTAVAITIALLCQPENRWTSLVVIAFAAMLFGLAAEDTLLSRFLSTRAMLLGGGISYSIYLVQMPVKFWVQDIAEWVHLGSESIRFALSTVALIVVSLILFRAVEDPARKLLRSIFARMESGRSGQTHRRQATT